jgi:predicted O-methyltransferase YrrM
MEFENRLDIGDFLKKLSLNNKGVEVGTFKGEFASHILKNWSGKLYMVDIWKPVNSDEYVDLTNNVYYLDAFKDTMENIKGYEDRGFMLRMDSKEASKLFNDESLDFVYIDANHTYDAVKEDLKCWYNKVRVGGVVMGHDYLPDYFYEGKEEKNQALYTYPEGKPEESKFTGMYGVNPAVNEFADENNYVVNKTNEFLASWWFIKK